MERIRIGNNIAISWAVYDLNGRIHNLEDKDIQLYMAVGGYKVYVNSYTIQGNVISWVFLGSEQTKTGDYKLVLEETDPLSGASAFCVRAAFRLTPEDVVGPDIVLGPANVSVQSVLTYSNLVGVESIDVVESSEDSGDNIVTLHLIDGSFAEVVIKNGSRGPKGDKGDTGATGPKGEKGDTGERGPVGVDTVNAAIGTNDPSQAPSVDKTFADGVLGLTFNNIKGAKGDKGDQGNTGSSVDYPYELVNNVTTDDATKGLSAAQGVALDGKISQLGQKVEPVSKKMRLVSPINLLDEQSLTSGYWIGLDGSVNEYVGYCYTKKIRVNEGDVINIWLGNNPTNIGQTNALAFTICAYNNLGVALPEKGAAYNKSHYEVPAGVEFIVLTFSVDTVALGTLQVIKGSDTPTSYHQYYDEYYVAESPFCAIRNNAMMVFGNLLSNQELVLPKTNIGKNLFIVFRADITSFGKITISQAPGEYYGGVVEIDGTNVVFTVENTQYTYAHGLTISGYISVILSVNNNNRLVLKIISNNSSYEHTIEWRGFANGSYVATCNNGTLTNCVFSVSAKDINADIFLFGDSYVAIAESDKAWTHYAIDNGCDNRFLLNAFPGEGSQAAFEALNNVLALAKPKYLIWALGMNDGGDVDIYTPNSTWLNYFKQVRLLCDVNNIEMIAVTIPTIATILNEGKNYFVRNSGLRYIDVAQALGADPNGGWYPNLNYDGTHPSALGAELIFNQVLCDFPEFIG